MCLRLLSFLAEILFTQINPIKNTLDIDSYSTSEDEPYVKTTHTYNLRNRLSVNYAETSDENLNSPEMSDNE
jgi:hypothetical protein